MWMSLARFLIALSRMTLHSLMTGASPDAFSRSTTLTSSSSPPSSTGVGVDVAEHVVVADLLLVVARDRFVDRDLGGDHDLDVEAGAELQIVDRVDVRRIGHRHDQRRAGAIDRQELMALGELRRNELEDVGRDLEVGEVDRRDAILLRKEVGQLLLIEDAELGQAVAQPCTGFTLLFLRFLQLRERDQILADQQLTQSTHSHSRDADRHTDQSVIEDISRA